MAETWQGTSTTWLSQPFRAAVTQPPDPSLSFELLGRNNQFNWTAALPEVPPTTLPVEVIMGGRRHGLGFLARINAVGGIPLQRPALIQTCYEWSFSRKALVLAPGCSTAKPLTLETAFGIVLSPTFEARCLACHGQPDTLGAGKSGGVHCESCHGPGSEHAHGPARANIVNPGRLSNEDSIAVCAQCHVGLTNFSDPAPEDLLVANQVRAVTSSECFIQSGKAFSCTTCHNPHGSENDNSRSIATCMSCHSPTAKPHAAICPVNATGNCIGCHMPSVEMGPLHLVDHMIRVHPEQGLAVRTGTDAEREARRSQIQPLREFLKVIVTKTAAESDAASLRLSQGQDFYDVARNVSLDGSAPIGGYLGAQWLSQMDKVVGDAAAKLGYGQTGRATSGDGRSVILQRLPRDFKWQAGQMQHPQQALRVYPHSLRALTSIGNAFAENGNLQRASEIFRLASRIYPKDAGVSAELGMTLGALGRRPEEIQAYRRALELEPDLLAAYPKLGMALYSAGETLEAIKVFRDGLNINPLSSELYSGLALILAAQDDVSAAKQARDLAAKISARENTQAK